MSADLNQVAITSRKVTEGNTTADFNSGMAVSGATFGKVLGEALHMMDEPKRNKLYAKAAEIAVKDIRVIPIYFTVNTGASRKSLTDAAQDDEISLAITLRPIR